MYPLFSQEVWDQRLSDQMKAAARDSLRSRRTRSHAGPLRRGLGRSLVQLGAWLVGHATV
jgi:hypothetical protein